MVAEDIHHQTAIAVTVAVVEVVHPSILIIEVGLAYLAASVFISQLQEIMIFVVLQLWSLDCPHLLLGKT